MKYLYGLMLILAAAVPTRASERVLAEVTQPVEGSGEGVLLANVSYVDWFSIGLDPWPSVRLTTAANSILTDRGAQNLNVANTLGIKTSLGGPLSADPSKPQGLRGDTLDVILSVPESPPARGSTQKSMDAVVGATLECVLMNARRYWPRLRYVSVLVNGNDAYAKLSGPYSLESIETQSTPRLPQERDLRPR